MATELELVHKVLIEALSKAAVGDFSTNIDVESGETPQAREILAGVQVLLESIRDKVHELEVAKAQLEDARK